MSQALLARQQREELPLRHQALLITKVSTMLYRYVRHVEGIFLTVDSRKVYHCRYVNEKDEFSLGDEVKLVSCVSLAVEIVTRFYLPRPQLVNNLHDERSILVCKERHMLGEHVVFLGVYLVLQAGW